MMTILLDTILAAAVVVLQYCFVVAMMAVEEDVEMLLHYWVVLEKEAMIPHEVEAVLNYLE